MNITRLSLWLIGVMVAGLCVWLTVSDQMLKYRFDRIRLGMSSAEVVATLGNPHSIDRCGRFDGNPARNCVREFSYVSPLEFWDVWIISFDKNDRVLRALRYKSP
jgi:hypothetical protein